MAKRFLSSIGALALMAIVLVYPGTLRAASAAETHQAPAAQSSAAPGGSHAVAAKAPAASHTDSPVTADAGAGQTFPADVPSPLPVGVALFVNGLSKINEAAGLFDANVDYQLRWRDPRLAFDAKSLGTDRQEYDNEAAIAKLATMWTPQVTIANLSDKDPRIERGLFVYSDGSVVYIQQIQATFSAKYALAAFPFDSQALPFRLVSSKYTINQIALTQDQTDVDASGVKGGMKVSGWSPGKTVFVASRLRSWSGAFKPQMEALVTIKRQPFSHLASILTPFILVMLVPTALTLIAVVEVAPRLTVWSGSILALVALNFTLTVRYPALDSDSLVSQVLATGYAFQMCMVILSLTVYNNAVAVRMADSYVLTEVKGFLRWCVPMGLVAVLASESLVTAFSW